MKLNSRRSGRLMMLCVAGLATLPFAGCDHRPSNEEIRQQTADATRDARKGAKEIAADTKVAAANAVNGVNAVAQGAKEGVNGNGGGDTDLVDINSAATARIAMLPGISLSKANDIVKGRPYGNAHEMVQRGLLTQTQYDHIAGKIVAK